MRVELDIIGEARLKNLYTGRWLTGHLDKDQVVRVRYGDFIESPAACLEKCGMR